MEPQKNKTKTSAHYGQCLTEEIDKTQKGLIHDCHGNIFRLLITNCTTISNTEINSQIYKSPPNDREEFERLSHPRRHTVSSWQDFPWRKGSKIPPMEPLKPRTCMPPFLTPPEFQPGANRRVGASRLSPKRQYGIPFPQDTPLKGK